MIRHEPTSQCFSCCTRASVIVSRLRDSNRRIRISLPIWRINLIIFHRSRLWGTNSFHCGGHQGSFVRGKAVGTRSLPSISTWSQKKNSWISVLTLPCVCVAWYFIKRGSTVRLPCVFVIFLYYSAVIPCLGIINAVILKVTGTRLLNDKWRGSYTTLYYCNV